MATKKQLYRAQIAAYRAALSEGRVLRIGDTSFKSYLTVEACLAAEATLRASGFPVQRVNAQGVA